ncbi:MAG: hypothetical protein ABSH51_13085 [Solirubrobacteraceae bacterium]|jgi:hypothetical protein
MPIVLMSALVCGAAIVAAARPDAAVLGRGIRAGVLTLAVGLGALALVFLVGNRDLDAASAAADGAPGTLAARARTAGDWVPWSPDPPRWLATIALADGDRAAARRLLSTAIGRDATDWSLWLEMAAASTGAAARVTSEPPCAWTPRGRRCSRPRSPTDCSRRPGTERRGGTTMIGSCPPVPI